MEHVFRIDGEDGPSYRIRVDEARVMTPELVRTVLEIDLQTFSEGTFSAYTAAVFLQHGRVFLLAASPLDPPTPLAPSVAAFSTPVAAFAPGLAAHGEDDELSAVIGTCVSIRSWADPDEVALLAMGIRPGWRGRGLGQRFISGVLSRLVAAGVHRVSLMVGPENRRALAVYRDVGFELVEERRADPRTDDTLLLLRCDLVAAAGHYALNGAVVPVNEEAG
jgi:ribosomal protein S18 acetylase RimI-like enzyme